MLPYSLTVLQYFSRNANCLARFCLSKHTQRCFKYRVTGMPAVRFINHEVIRDENKNSPNVVDQFINHEVIRDENKNSPNVVDQFIKHEAIRDENKTSPNVVDQFINHEAIRDENKNSPSVVDPIDKASNANFTENMAANYNRYLIESIPVLMYADQWPIMRTNFINNFLNWTMKTFNLKSFFRNFKDDHFIFESKQILLKVSSILAEGKFEELEEFVTPEAIEEIRENYSSFNDEHKLLLKVDPQHIATADIFEITGCSEEQESRQFVQITVLFHILEDYKNVLKRKITVEHKDFILDNMLIINYRFKKELNSEGEEKDKNSPWKIDLLNYYRRQNCKKLH